jgi:hypothetical protein
MHWRKGHTNTLWDAAAVRKKRNCLRRAARIASPTEGLAPDRIFPLVQIRVADTVVKPERMEYF